jgi:ferredoxin-thioredoxin reductase catalytic subunit
MKKTIDEVRSYVERIAGKHDWKVTSHQDMLAHLLDGLRVNFNRYGY